MQLESTHTMLLTFEPPRDGLQECRLDLALLFPQARDRAGFEQRWGEFFSSDPAHCSLFRRPVHDLLAYQTESFVPTEADSRPPLLILLGNPASHSVASGLCFAYEGKGHEHRFWRALRETGLLEFTGETAAQREKAAELTAARKARIFSLDYASPFRVGIATYYTLPSPASGPRWSGVSGLRRLMGTPALASIEEFERGRIGDIARSFLHPQGGIIAFQRDAYEGVRDSSAPPYALEAALEGDLRGGCAFSPSVRVFGMAPTRVLNSARARRTLREARAFMPSARL